MNQVTGWSWQSLLTKLRGNAADLSPAQSALLGFFQTNVGLAVDE